MNIEDKIIECLRGKSYRHLNEHELIKNLKITSEEIKDFNNGIDALQKDGTILKSKKGKFYLSEEIGLVNGTFQGNAKGYGFVLRKDGLKDIFIPANAVNGAVNGDIVLTKVTKNELEGKKCEGEIEKVVVRKNTKLIGVYEDNPNFGFVVPKDKRISKDIFIPKNEKNGAKTGDVVEVKIINWGVERRSPEGKVIEVLGKNGENDVEILSIIKKYGLPEEFPKKVLDYTEKIDVKIPEEEYKRRRIIEGVNVVTIDGEDSKDFDDAVSIELLDNGNYRLGVHIADVTYYVKEKNPLDIEAFKRGTSVYLIDIVIPMLPQKLSNGICSLNPKEDRLALSCVMTIDKEGKVIDHETFESIIHSNERMTYGDVTKILKDEDENLIKRYDYLVDDFKKMESLCHILRKKRLARGAIDFDFDESYIKLDKNGKPIEIKPYEREISNKIIEEFMLVTNETIAENFFWSKVPFVYRIHEEPDEEKLNKFKDFIYNLGHPIKYSGEIHPRHLQEILDDYKGKPEETVVSTLLLRSMMQAKYSPECVGHFGLSAKYYCHFTSPIRRYPDLMIHRIIKEFNNGKLNEKEESRLNPIVSEASIQSSQMERLAEEAEREVDNLKKAQYMQDKLGEEFTGIVSSVTNFGIFVTLPNTIEGLVHINSLEDDFYTFDEKNLTLSSMAGGKIYKLGDSVDVYVERVDIDRREIFFGLKEEREKFLEKIN